MDEQEPTTTTPTAAPADATDAPAGSIAAGSQGQPAPVKKVVKRKRFRRSVNKVSIASKYECPPQYQV